MGRIKIERFAKRIMPECSRICINIINYECESAKMKLAKNKKLNF